MGSNLVRLQDRSPDNCLICVVQLTAEYH